MRLLYTGLILLVLTFPAIAQERVEPAIIPPAPDAAKLTEFGLTPANLYSGKQNFSIPLYQTDFYGLPLTISLNYSSGGIKVSEEASWVGLGWSLSAGGMVSRSVRGEDDFLSNGYIFDDVSIPDEIPTVDLGDGEYTYNVNQGYLGHVKNNRADTEPDAYNYNFLGASGSFILSKKSETGGEIKAIKVSENADRIEYDEAEDVFRVYNPLGFVGVFSLKEFSTSVGGTDQNGGIAGCNLSQIDLLQTFNNDKRAPTSWHLTEVRSPNGRSLKFEYKVESDGLSNYLSRSAKTFGERMSMDAAHQPGDTYAQACSYSIFENVYLSRIYSEDLNLEINFISENRQDIRALDAYLAEFAAERGEANLTVLEPQKLSQIQVRPIDHNSQLLHTIDFDQSYFRSDKELDIDAEDYLRLKLDGVTVDDQTYTFDYLAGEDENGDPVGLPSKSSMSIDYWGYFNGQQNERLLPASVNYDNIPSFLLHPLLPSQQFYFQTPERKANLKYGRAGLLHSVTYPTGGYTSYEYEPHEYRLSGKEIAYFEGDYILPLDGTSPAPEGREKPFDYLGFIMTPGGSCQQGVEVRLSVACSGYWQPGQTCAPPDYPDDEYAVEIRNSANQIVASVRFNELHRGNTSYYSETVTLELPAGEYHAVTRTKSNGNDTYYGFVNISYPKTCVPGQENPLVSDVQYNEKAGGARIKRITNHLASGKVTEKRSFSYYEDTGGDVFSSGKLASPLMHFYQQTKFNHDENTDPNNNDENNDGIPDGTITGFFYVYQSGSALPGGGALSGGHVGYSRVVEHFEGAEGGSNGKRISYFHNQENAYAAFGSSLLQTYQSSNGWMKSQSTFDANGKTVHQLEYPQSSTEISEELGSIKAFKVARIGGTIGVFNRYNIKRAFTRYPEETTIEYLDGGAITTQKVYTYSADFQKNSESITNSNGDVITTYYKRPGDYTSPSPVIADMISKNMIGQVIEQKKTVNGQVVQASATEYQSIPKEPEDPPLPEPEPPIVVSGRSLIWNEDIGAYTESSNGTSFGNAFVPRLEFTKYDNYGNLTEYVNAAGVPTTIIWGYDGNYPVAEIKNAFYDDVSVLIDESVLNNPADDATVISILNGARQHESMKDALFTIMTHKRNIGMSSQTGPNGLTTYYIYDNIGRLLAIKDHEQNVLKAFDYGYKHNVTTPILK